MTKKTNDLPNNRKPDPREELEQELSGKNPENIRDRQEAKGQKATQFDGNPNPQGTPSSTFGPQDDTPARLKKVKGPSNDRS